MGRLAVLIIVLTLVVAVLLLVYGVRAIMHRRQDWAIADAEWTVQVLPGKRETNIVLRQVARVGSKCKVIQSEPYNTVSRDNPDHDIEVMIQKDAAERYAATLT